MAAPPVTGFQADFQQANGAGVFMQGKEPDGRVVQQDQLRAGFGIVAGEDSLLEQPLLFEEGGAGSDHRRVQPAQLGEELAHPGFVGRTGYPYAQPAGRLYLAHELL
ncbi:hypothetical protein D3C72_2029820 [compost metagenome]